MISSWRMGQRAPNITVRLYLSSSESGVAARSDVNLKFSIYVCKDSPARIFLYQLLFLSASCFSEVLWSCSRRLIGFCRSSGNHLSFIICSLLMPISKRVLVISEDNSNLGSVSNDVWLLSKLIYENYVSIITYMCKKRQIIEIIVLFSSEICFYFSPDLGFPFEYGIFVFIIFEPENCFI